MAEPSLHDHVSGQSARLCAVTGTDPAPVADLLADLLGPAGAGPRTHGPAWPSDIADDHTPVEFSVAFDRTGGTTLRVLAEAQAAPPGPAANLAAAHRFLARRAGEVSTARLDRVRDLFGDPGPDAVFALWFSLVFPAGRAPEYKVYLNPELRGAGHAPELVDVAAHRLGVRPACRHVLRHAARPGQLGRLDRLSFFALDLHDGPHTRIKLYLSHHDARPADVLRAGALVDGVDPDELAAFCTTAGGGPGPFTGRPLISSFTLAPGAERPIGYSVYVPVRGYVRDDREARDRVAALLERYGGDPRRLDDAVAAVAGRPLSAGSGLIAHVSLRLGPPRPGVTVYLSSEAYRDAVARTRPVPAY